MIVVNALYSGGVGHYSFHRVARNVIPYLEQYDDVTYVMTQRPMSANRELIICDWIVFYSTRKHLSLRGNTVLWVDSALYEPTDKRMFTNMRNVRLIASSKWDKENMERLGLHVEDVIPRPYNKIARDMVLSKNEGVKEYDYAFIGWRDPYVDRKNMDVLLEIAKRRQDKKFMLITNDRRFDALRNVKRYDFASVSELNKYSLLRKCKWMLFLSKCEGFGMPCLEAMSLGVPCIFSDAQAHNEFSCGIRIPIKNVKYAKWIVGYFKLHEVTLEDALNALSEAEKADHTALSAEAKKKGESVGDPVKVAERLAQHLLH